MSFGTPQRVINLRRDYEKSLRLLGSDQRHYGSSSGSHRDASFVEADSLDMEGEYGSSRGEVSPVRGFGGYTSPSPWTATRSPASSSSHPHSQSRSRERGGAHHVHSQSDGYPALSMDKDEQIRELHEEVDRLKAKVNAVVERAEDSLQEAIESQQVRAYAPMHLSHSPHSAPESAPVSASPPLTPPPLYVHTHRA